MHSTFENLRVWHFVSQHASYSGYSLNITAWIAPGKTQELPNPVDFVGLIVIYLTVETVIYM